jgi:hypothetical protein
MGDLFAAYDRFITLMDRTMQAIDRKDLEEVGLAGEQMSPLTAEMQALFLSVVAAAGQQPIASLERFIREALERVRSNEMRLAAWLHETGDKRRSLRQGAAAVRDYAPSIINPPILERRV